MDGIDREPAAPTALRRVGAHHCTVLIVGAEQSVRSVIHRMLARRGFDVREASSAEEALRVMRAHLDEIAGVVLDLGMPAQVSGEIFTSLRLARPDLPILFTGGYGEEVLAERLAGASRTDFLPKPFGLDALGAKADDLFAAG